MSRFSFPYLAWPHTPPAGLAARNVLARTVPLRGRDPQRIMMIIDGDRASLGYAIYCRGPDGEWCIEGPTDAEEGLARAQVLSSVAGLPIILSRAKDDCSCRL